MKWLFGGHVCCYLCKPSGVCNASQESQCPWFVDFLDLVLFSSPSRKPCGIYCGWSAQRVSRRVPGSGQTLTNESVLTLCPSSRFMDFKNACGVYSGQTLTNVSIQPCSHTTSFSWFHLLLVLNCKSFGTTNS